MVRRLPRLAVAVLALGLLFAGTPVAIATASETATNPWLQGRFPNIAHSGGEREAPANGPMPARPALLERILNERGIARPGTPGDSSC
jgi:glycerophosphoryl diester phosphodiesterase